VLEEIYSLNDLGEKVDINPRSIRSYIQQGLMRGPDTKGRNAQYGPYHLRRLNVIKTLKEVHKLSLVEIRRLITMAGAGLDTDEGLSSALELLEAGSSKLRDDAPRADRKSKLSRMRSSRLQNSKSSWDPNISEYMASESPRSARPQRAESAYYHSRNLQVSPQLEDLLRHLRRMLTVRPQRGTKSEDWTRLPITSDVELHIRGQLSPAQLACFEEISDIIRHILLGEESL